MTQRHGASETIHKRPKYLIVFAVLVVLTVLEVLVAGIQGIPQTPILLALMTAKAVLVAMFYMHLQSDSRWFAAFILLPIPFIVLIATAMIVR
jgi:caa(3)-type oxidase subunit IV